MFKGKGRGGQDELVLGSKDLGLMVGGFDWWVLRCQVHWLGMRVFYFRIESSLKD